MRRSIPALLIAMLVLALGATTVLADGSQTVTPTKKQKAGILKAWNNGDAVPASKSKCYTVQLSKNNKVWAGLKFNTKASGCGAAAFDGTALLWGSGGSWNLFMEGSSVNAATCTAMANALGVSPWVDLVDYAGGMGCENID
ncbi:MAG: hypothetical protein NWS62_00865 [Gaiellales bacterium]|jgi:hypothetical protein|nr:hypothetical protein [Gaiellales bacterium]